MRLRKNNPTNGHKATNALLQDPNFPAPIPLPVEPKPRPNYRDPTLLAGLALLPRDGMTVIMPAVQPHWPTAALDDTQVLPIVSEPVPPSARHTDPARRYYEQTFVEDDDTEPESRGKHVLAELTAGPDVATELMAVQNHIHNIFDPMRRAAVAAQAGDERMRQFTAQWDARQNRTEREFESWAARFKKALAETRANWAATSGRTNADRLAMAYEAGGTSAALFTTKELAAEIARRDELTAASTAEGRVAA